MRKFGYLAVMRAVGICEAPAGWHKGGGAPPLWPWALGEGAWTTKLPLIVGEWGGPHGVPPSLSKGSVPLPFQGADDDVSHRALSGGPGLSCDQRSWRLFSQCCDTQASAQLPVSQRGAFGCMEPYDGIELQLPVVSLMSSLRCTDAFGT